MDEKQKQALICFMEMTLDAVYPNHRAYPVTDLRYIEDAEGEDGEGWNVYPEFIIKAYWMKRHIEAIAGRRIWT